MNLTYEIVEGGYYILKDGKRWMEQIGIFPYEGATVEESAQNHINAWIAENEQVPSTPNLEDEIESLKQLQTEQDTLIMQLMLGGA